MAQRYVLLSGLRSAAFPDVPHPGALAYVPPYLDRDHLSVVIYLHGFDNCIQNVVEPHPGRCLPDGELCPSADLIGHLDRSGRSAVLLVPEVRYCAKSADPGAFGTPGALLALLGEVFERLAPQLGGAGVDDLEHAIVVSHSGAYRAAAGLAVDGGVAVQEVYLLDSLYGEQEAFLRYVTAAPEDFGAEQWPGRRLVNLYTDSGGTREHSRAFGRQIVQALTEAGVDPVSVYCDDGSGPISDAELGKHVVCKRVMMTHSAMPITYFGRLLQRSGLPAAVVV